MPSGSSTRIGSRGCSRVARRPSGHRRQRQHGAGRVSRAPGLGRRRRRDGGRHPSHAAFLAGAPATTGVTITLALEPEPACCIETVDDAVGFFRPVSVRRRHGGSSRTAAGIPRPLRTCAVTSASASTRVTWRSSSRIRPPRCGAAHDAASASVRCRSALRFGCRRPTTRRAARRADAVCGRHLPPPGGRAHGPRRSRGTPTCPTRSRIARASSRLGEWRVHFHVPIFLASDAGVRNDAAVVAATIGPLKQRRCLPVPRSRDLHLGCPSRRVSDGRYAHGDCARTGMGPAQTRDLNGAGSRWRA